MSLRAVNLNFSEEIVPHLARAPPDSRVILAHPSQHTIYWHTSVQWEERFMIIPCVFVLTTVAQIATILILSPYNLHHLRLQFCDILNDILYYFIDPIK